MIPTILIYIHETAGFIDDTTSYDPYDLRYPTHCHFCMEREIPTLIETGVFKIWQDGHNGKSKRLVCKCVGVSYSELFLFNVYSILVYTLILEIEGRARKGRARRECPVFQKSVEKIESNV